MAVDNRELVHAAMELRSAAPDQWVLLVQALGNYAANLTSEMVRADPSLLLRAQGMAMACHEIFGVLRDAPTLNEKYLVAQMQKRPNNHVPNSF